VHKEVNREMNDMDEADKMNLEIDSKLSLAFVASVNSVNVGASSAVHIDRHAVEVVPKFTYRGCSVRNEQLKSQSRHVD